MAEFEITADTKAAEELLGQVSDFMADPNLDRILGKVAFFAESQILKRTARGKDFQGKTFTGYSRGYAQYRKDAGRPTTWVDLNFTGRMTAALTHEPGPKKVTLFFAGAREAEKAAKHHEGIGVPARKFFDIPDKDISTMQSMVLAFWDKGII